MRSLRYRLGFLPHGVDGLSIGDARPASGDHCFAGGQANVFAATTYSLSQGIS